MHIKKLKRNLNISANDKLRRCAHKKIKKKENKRLRKEYIEEVCACEYACACVFFVRGLYDSFLLQTASDLLTCAPNHKKSEGAWKETNLRFEQNDLELGKSEHILYHIHTHALSHACVYGRSLLPL